MHSQCPHCHSSFDIPDSAIEAAEGIVRCGNCMQLFDARAQSISQSLPVDEQQNDDDSLNNADDALTNIDVSVGEKNEESEVVAGSDAPIDIETPDPDVDELIVSSAPTDDAVTPAQEDTSPDDDLVETSTTLSEQDAVHDTEDHSTNPQETERETTPETDVVGLSVDSEALFTPEIEMASLTGDEQDKAAPDFSFLDDADLTASAQSLDVDADSELQESPDISEEVSQVDVLASRAFSDLDEDSTGRETSFAVLPPADPGLLRPGGNSARRSVSATGLLGIACGVLLAALLGMQWLSAYSDTSQWPASTQPLLARWCELMYCNSSASGASFVSEDRVIHSHPDKPDALVLRATLINAGNQPLPFPHLALEFSDLQDEPLARRIFRPEEYLSQPLLENKQGLIPQDTPVKIEIEIADPGDKAVNYSLRYFVPTS